MKLKLKKKADYPINSKIFRFIIDKYQYRIDK